MIAKPVAAGLYGKLPARGDFVRAGLPRRFTDPWDDWLQSSLAAGRACLGDAFVPAWLEAPIWRFVLAAGLCGPDPALGLWMPSTDRAGRHFPLTFARVGPPGQINPGAQGFLDTAEHAGLTAIAADLSPEFVMAVLARAPAASRADLHPLAEGTLWWTLGGPRCSSRTLRLPGLPDGETFAMMLDEAAACR
jgi:type VI secretion system protein ImpM